MILQKRATFSVLAVALLSAVYYFTQILLTFHGGRATTVQTAMEVAQNGSLTLVSYIPSPRLRTVKKGKPIMVPTHLFKEVINLNSFVDLTSSIAQQFVFVTAVSSTYFPHSVTLISILQKRFPERKLIYNDLGLHQREVALITTLCNVNYRKFDFAKYPDHVRYLKNYAFKNIAIYEALRHHPAVVWMDSSIRINSTDLGFLTTAIQHHGFLHFNFGAFHTVTTTHPGLYQYIPVNEAVKTTIKNREAGFGLYFRTRELYTNVIQWMVFCALDVQCIEPSHPRHLLECRFKEMKGPAKRWRYCHRYDQSLLALLISNFLAYNDSNPIYKNPIHWVDRQNLMKALELQHCQRVE